MRWIQKSLKYYEDREKALAYYTLIKIGVSTNNDKNALKKILLAQQNKFDLLSEIDLIFYLKAAITINLKDVIMPIIKSLEKNQKDGFWVDLATTATAVTSLIDYLLLTNNNIESTNTHIKSRIESLIFKSIIYIQNHKEDIALRKKITYPWDDKASTSLKCIQAWQKFEELIDLPVHEIIDALKSFSSNETKKSSNKTALTILEELRDENTKLLERTSKYSIELNNSKRAARLNRVLWLSLLSCLYFILSIFIQSLIIGFNMPLEDIFFSAFIEGWTFHVPFIALIISIYGIIPLWKAFIKKGENNGGKTL